MVSLKDVRKSNSALSQHTSNLVAVFVGATSGIGLGTLKQFAKQAKTPKVYVIGRSKAAATPLLNELETSNPNGKFEFIETETSLIKNVDLACEEIKSKEKKVDILFMSVGYLTWDGRKESIEGIDIPHALRYYSRLRFAYDLLPLLTASPVARVVSILAGGKEEAIDLDDLEVKNNFDTIKAAKNGTTQTTLAFEELAKSYPSITFIHKFPGFVNSGVVDRLMSTAKGIYSVPATMARWFLVPVINLFATTIDVAGERGLFIATSARYPPAKPKTDAVGVPLPQEVQLARSSVTKDNVGNGVYRLGADDESAEESPALSSYRLENVGATVWAKTQEVWDRALGKTI